VGGGAGGLELAIKLGRHYKGKNTKVILVDKNRTHIWKPLLHEVAAGSLDPDIDGVDYLAIGNKNGFVFHLGSMSKLDRQSHKITLSPLLDADGDTVLKARELEYTKLIFAIGSVTNDFGIPGVQQNCIFLDTPDSAQQFHVKLLNEFLRLQADETQTSLEIAIVGAGATGVELAAELYKTSELLKSYGYNHLSKNRLKVSVLEAGPRLLGALPERIANSTKVELEKLGVDILLSTAVTKVDSKGLYTKDGHFIPARLSVWAAGIKAPDFLANIGGLETNKTNQIVVNRHLTSVTDPSIYALGDCAQCTMSDGSKVPPRAQSAHQMADHIFKNIKRIDKAKEQVDYKYVDYGSLVSLSTYSTIGSLMGNLTSGSMFIEGRLARMVYISLYRMHQVVIFGKLKTLLFMFVSRINNKLRPNLKLH
jgi:NADH dehydrogenase